MSKKHVHRKQKRSLLTLSRIDLDEMLDCLCQLEKEIKKYVVLRIDVLCRFSYFWSSCSWMVLLRYSRWRRRMSRQEYTGGLRCLADHGTAIPLSAGGETNVGRLVESCGGENGRGQAWGCRTTLD